MRRPLSRTIALVFASGACAFLSGCVSPADELPPSIETLRVLREQAVPPMALGAFTPAGKDVGRSVTIRLSVMKPPTGHNYAEFLGQTFETELKAAGKLDPQAHLKLEGVLTDSHVGENMSKGGAWLGARIMLSRDGRVLLAKPYRVDAKWGSDFIGAIAIPEAFRQYNALYAVMVRQVFADPDFVAAAKQ